MPKWSDVSGVWSDAGESFAEDVDQFAGGGAAASLGFCSAGAVSCAIAPADKLTIQRAAVRTMAAHVPIHRKDGISLSLDMATRTKSLAQLEQRHEYSTMYFCVFGKLATSFPQEYQERELSVRNADCIFFARHQLKNFFISLAATENCGGMGVLGGSTRHLQCSPASGRGIVS